MGAGLGRHFRPKRQLFVSDLPNTGNTKILRRVVKAMVTCGDPGDLTALLNPGAIAELRRGAGESGASPRPDSTRGAQPDLGPLAWKRAARVARSRKRDYSPLPFATAPPDSEQVWLVSHEAMATITAWS